MPAEGNRLIVSLDSTRPGDSVFVHDGKVMLVLDAQAAHALAQCTVDVLPNRHTEPQFVLRPSWGTEARRAPPRGILWHCPHAIRCYARCGDTWHGMPVTA